MPQSYNQMQTDVRHNGTDIQENKSDRENKSKQVKKKEPSDKRISNMILK